MNKRETVLITGALGHIGSYLVREISREVSRVRLLDNLSSERYASLFDLPHDREYEFFAEDILTAPLEERLKGVSAVIHLAAITNAEASVGREKKVEEVNFKGLARVADACLTAGVPILFPSTTSVYGSQEKLVDETCADLRPQSPYADSKLRAEIYLRELRGKGLRFVICRFGTIFGWSVGMRFHTAVNKFTWQSLLGLPITVWKTAWEQRRPYLYLGDCVRAINFILEKDLFDGETYNVLTGNFTVKEVVSAIKGFVPDLRIEYVDSRIMNQLSYDVSDAKFRARGFLPSGDLSCGVGETIARLRGVRLGKEPA